MSGPWIGLAARSRHPWLKHFMWCNGLNMNITKILSYDEDLVEAPDADDYSSFWYGAASPEDVQG